MKRLAHFFARHKKAIVAAVALVIAGAFFRWEIREVNDAATGQAITRYTGLAWPWQTCGARGEGRAIKFHVHQWLAYGLISVEARGTTS